MLQGKTVISLALILRNPAPTYPVSGSSSSSLKGTIGTTGQPFWDPSPAAPTKHDNNKEGAILSRGTLVVCTVSLVGQWIEEAKSKLKDPGLVYPYHGGSRRRNPFVLARNSIVVTTYETLASDAVYHKNKSNDPNYCPPCEQVRWWRIICDESHVLRNVNTKRVMATASLVGDNKWMVTGTPCACTHLYNLASRTLTVSLSIAPQWTGTPVNTCIADLRSQLSFLGLDDVASHIYQRQRKDWSWKDGDYVRYQQYMFLLRPILMRHSQQQTYRGTRTTLMSLPPKVRTAV